MGKQKRGEGIRRDNLKIFEKSFGNILLQKFPEVNKYIHTYKKSLNGIPM